MLNGNSMLNGILVLNGLLAAGQASRSRRPPAGSCVPLVSCPGSGLAVQAVILIVFLFPEGKREKGGSPKPLSTDHPITK